MPKFDKDELKKNGSGCSDPTAFAAIMKITRDGKMKPRSRDKDVNDMMSIIKRILDIMDFRLEGRLTLIDKQTGRKYE